MNLERLERFVVVATLKNEAGQVDMNISRAAEQLHIPQSYLSRQIKQLEHELGVTLFLRKPRLVLTPQGEFLLREAQHLLAQVEWLKRSAHQASQGEIGRLIIGVNTSISNSLLPDILRIFRQRFPQVNLVLKELLISESRQALEEQKIDVDFENTYNLQDVDEHHVLTYERLLQEPLVGVLPKDHSLASAAALRLEDLAHEPFIMPHPQSVPALHMLIRNACLAAGFQPSIVQEAAWMPTVLGLVAGGLGVTLLPQNVMNLQRSGVVYCQLENQLPRFELAIAWRRDNSSKVLHNFLETAREVAVNKYLE